ncbi:hypothetical protein GUJ93_ZPchr0005g14231 [Zizania palustris]|uniref:Uncharacterized protein n=1 Tax=Zizania palustris TaxID=103762 RepID=A0A8J5S3L1_ZIZPA|nr:hypothetical protein GUJ93_ZPchr0005g14231 [Zizania palustris]
MASTMSVASASLWAEQWPELTGRRSSDDGVNEEDRPKPDDFKTDVGGRRFVGGSDAEDPEHLDPPDSPRSGVANKGSGAQGGSKAQDDVGMDPDDEDLSDDDALSKIPACYYQSADKGSDAASGGGRAPKVGPSLIPEEEGLFYQSGKGSEKKSIAQSVSQASLSADCEDGDGHGAKMVEEMQDTSVTIEEGSMAEELSVWDAYQEGWMIQFRRSLSPSEFNLWMEMRDICGNVVWSGGEDQISWSLGVEMSSSGSSSGGDVKLQQLAPCSNPQHVGECGFKRIARRMK